MSSIQRTTVDRVLRTMTTAVLAVTMAASIGLSQPTPVEAAPKKAKTITRQKVIKRAQTWVKRRVPYSQSRHYGGYRQDCSGFVSMAWQLGRSYTTRTLPSVSRRIPLSKIKTGDAVLAPGHVTIFGGWKSRAKRQYYAFEEPTWGKVARRKVRTMPSNARILRRPGIRDAVRRKPAPKPVPTPAPMPVPMPSLPATPSIVPTMPGIPLAPEASISMLTPAPGTPLLP